MRKFISFRSVKGVQQVPERHHKVAEAIEKFERALAQPAMRGDEGKTNDNLLGSREKYK